jgi:hypothetical protein
VSTHVLHFVVSQRLQRLFLPNFPSGQDGVQVLPFKNSDPEQEVQLVELPVQLLQLAEQLLQVNVELLKN